jgi:hypothetical protein
VLKKTLEILEILDLLLPTKTMKYYYMVMMMEIVEMMEMQVEILDLLGHENSIISKTKPVRFGSRFLEVIKFPFLVPTKTMKYYGNDDTGGNLTGPTDSASKT